MRNFFALLAASALSCTGHVIVYFWSYDVAVDPSFTPGQQVLVREAASKWSPAITTHVHTGPCSHGVATICIVASHEAALDGKGTNGSLAIGLCSRSALDSTIQVDVDKPWFDGEFRHVIEHELGHAFGLPHAGEGTVMYAYAAHEDVQDTAAQDVTAEDLAAVVALR
jgi:hypothetical protein